MNKFISLSCKGVFMKAIAIIILLFFYAIITNAAELKMDAYGKSKTKVYTLSKDRIFLTYFSESVWTNNMGMRGKGICEGILEIIKGNTSSNIMCHATDEEGYELFFQFKASSDTTDLSTSGTQKFKVVAGTGRYKELVGFSGISATASILPKDLGDGNYEDFYSWAGKGEIPDATFERIKNFKKPE